MLASILNLPRNKEDWDRWAWHHRLSHDGIRQAILAKSNTLLPDYQLEPIPLDQPRLFLEANQQAHTDFDGALGLQASDLEDVELSDQHQLQAWLYLHWLEHNSAEQLLGIST